MCRCSLSVSLCCKCVEGLCAVWGHSIPPNGCCYRRCVPRSRRLCGAAEVLLVSTVAACVFSSCMFCSYFFLIFLTPQRERLVLFPTFHGRLSSQSDLEPSLLHRGLHCELHVDVLFELFEFQLLFICFSCWWFFKLYFSVILLSLYGMT